MRARVAAASSAALLVWGCAGEPEPRPVGQGTLPAEAPSLADPPAGPPSRQGPRALLPPGTSTRPGGSLATVAPSVAPQYPRQPRDEGAGTDASAPAGVADVGVADLFDCEDFPEDDFGEAAQRVFLAAGGPEEDVYDLDRDGDGNACEYSPWAGATPAAAPSPGPGCHEVAGYRRRDGVYVRGHVRCR